MNAPPSLVDVLLETRESIATITLNRPEQRNPLSVSMMRDVRAALSWCKAEPEVAVVVLTGAGERAFCAGADLSGFGGEQSPLELHHGRHALAEDLDAQRDRVELHRRRVLERLGQLSADPERLHVVDELLLDARVAAEGEAARVWVVQGANDLALRQIHTGRINNGMVEVLDGLKPGDKVVTRGSLFIDRAAQPG